MLLEQRQADRPEALVVAPKDRPVEAEWGSSPADRCREALRLDLAEPLAVRPSDPSVQPSDRQQAESQHCLLELALQRCRLASNEC